MIILVQTSNKKADKVNTENFMKYIKMHRKQQITNTSAGLVKQVGKPKQSQHLHLQEFSTK